MNLSSLFLRRLVILLALSWLGAAAMGCGKKSTPPLIKADSFASAPADVRNEWKTAADCVAANDFMGAVTNLADIFGKAAQLTPEQNEALNQAWQDLGNRAFAVANQGDKTATEAVLKMRDLKLGDQTGSR